MPNLNQAPSNNHHPLAVETTDTAPAPPPSVSTAVSPPWRNPLDNYDKDFHPDFGRAHSAVRQWVYAVSEGQAKGLVLWSEENTGPDGEKLGYGCGKTHLAQLAYQFLREVSDWHGQSQRVVFLRTTDYLGVIRDCYDTHQPIVPYLNSLGAGHIILDDFGKEYIKAESLAWGQEQFYQLLDRLAERRGIFLTSNLRPSEIERRLGGASWSRLFGMCGEAGFINLSNIPDYRAHRARIGRST